MLFHVDAAHTRFHVDLATFENARIVDGFFWTEKSPGTSSPNSLDGCKVTLKK